MKNTITNVVMVTVSPYNEETGIISFHRKITANPNALNVTSLHINNFQLVRLLDELERYIEDYVKD